MNDEKVYGVGVKELLEAGVYFGHQRQKWHPKMAPYIFSERNNIHIIDLERALAGLKEACDYLYSIAKNGESVIFVGTKKQAQDVLKEEAIRCGMFYVISRWLGGTLTNFSVILKSIEYYENLKRMEESGELEKLPMREVLGLRGRLEKFERLLCGLRGLRMLPAAIYVVDTKKEHIAVAEAKKVGVAVVAMVDTNSNPEAVDYCIPANDDAVKSIKLITKAIANAIIAGREVRDSLQKDEEIFSE